MKVGRTLLAAVLLAIVALTLPRPAAAQTDLLDVRITGVSTPTLHLADPSQEITLTGTLTNASTEPVSYVNVHFWRLAEPITTQDRLTELTSGGEPPLGGRLFDEAAGNLHNLTREAWLRPGERAEFSVRASVAQLTAADDDPMTVDDTAYLIGVQVRGIPQTGGNRTVGRAHVAIAATQRPVQSSSVVVLAAKPTLLPDGTFTDDSLATDLNGRLETLLTSGERPGVVTAVDPLLYEAATVMSESHVVAGQRLPGSGVALRWVSRVDALADAGRLWRLPYANPDLTRAHADGTLAAVLEASGRDGGLGEIPTVAVIDANPEGLVAQLADFDTIIARNSVGTVPGTPPILSSTPPTALSSLPEGVRLAHEIAAEMLADDPPLYLIDTVDAANDDNEGAELRQHVAPTVGRGTPLRMAEGTAPQPWPTVEAALTRARNDADFVATLTGSPSTFDAPGVTAVAHSRGFTTEEAAAAYVAAASPTRVDENSLEFRAVGSFVMGSRTNTFPATVANNLPVPVTVGVHFTSDTPQRIRVPDIQPVTVPPGEQITLTISPQASANGVARINAQLTTIEGELVGRPVEIEVTATDFGRVGWILILVSGAVVVGGSALRIIAVRRERAKENSEPSQ